MASWEEFSRTAGERIERPGAPLRVEAFSDGSSRGNPGPGGYGALLRYTAPDGRTHERELRRGWKTAGRQPVKNVDLWKRLIAACEPHEVTWVWVRGHAGHPENERCDELACSAADGADLADDAGFDG